MYRVLFISDNDYLIRNVMDFVKDNQQCLCSFFRTSLSSKSYLACKDDIPAIDVKKEYQSLIGKYDVIFSIHCMQLFPAELLKNVRCINVHPGYNPYNRGWYPQVFGIINHLPCGATIHEIDEKLDHGAILFQKQVRVDSWDTSRTIYDRVLECELELLKNNFMVLVSGAYKKIEPSNEGNLNLKADFNKLCAIDLNEKTTYGQAIDRLRALTHPPYANAFFMNADGKKVKVSIILSPEDGE